jgi:hypothetical protein
MKKIVTVVIITMLFSMIYVNAVSYKTTDAFTTTAPFVLFDFDDRQPMSTVSGQSGIFDFDPNDAEAYCRVGFIKDEDLHKTGYHMRVSYDVNSSKPSFNGWWTKLNGADLSKCDALSITIKGDPEKGFSDFFKIELKDKERKIEYIVEDVTDKWKQIVIPFTDFDGDIASMDWKKMNEFVIVFEDWRLKTKEGRYIIDDISFVPKKGEKITFGDIKSGSSSTTTTTKTTDVKKEDTTKKK